MRQDGLEMPEVVAGAWRGDVEHGPGSYFPGPGEELGEGFGIDSRQDQETAEVENPGVGFESPVEVVDG